MKTYKINGIKNETFTIGSIEDISNLNELSKGLQSKGLQSKIFTMSRITEGTRKKEQNIPCYRFKTGEFVTII